MMKTFKALFFIGLALPAQAGIYKYVDAEGNITFTDRFRPGAVRMDGSQDQTEPSRPRKPERTDKAARPDNFPKIDRATQQKRDDVRRSLLLEERRNEEQALTTLWSQLKERTQDAAEQLRIKEGLRLHEKNIEMLDKELSRIK